MECPKAVVILAGGVSERFGSYKMVFQIGGKPLIKNLISRIEGCFSEIYISVRYKWQEDELSRFVNVDGFIYDDIEDLGPLSGIISSSDFLKDIGKIVFIPGDNLWVDGEAISQLFRHIHRVQTVSSPNVNGFIDTLTMAIDVGLIRKFKSILVSIDKKLRPSDIHRFSSTAKYIKYSVEGLTDLDIFPSKGLELPKYRFLGDVIDTSLPQKYYRDAVEKLRRGDIHEAANLFYKEYMEYKKLNLQPLARHSYRDFEILRRKL